jgi:hypothetical protein
MTDLDKIFECLIDKSYQNKAQFEMLLSNIEDKDLVVGFLFDLLLKHTAYEADKQTILELIAETLGEIKPREYIKGCHNTFTEKIKKVNDENLAESLFIKDALTALISVLDKNGEFTRSTERFERTVSACQNKEHLQKLKEQLLEGELYEVIGIVDKYLL